MKLHPLNVARYVDMEEAVIAEARGKVSDVRRLLERCESPLEQKFLLDYLHYCGNTFRTYTYEDEAPSLFFDNIFDGVTRLDGQHHVSVGGHTFRLDFLFSYLSDELASTEFVRLAVEIDGHQFHERTPEQAKRDRSRDRLLTSAGYHVFRFTGAEVYAPFRPTISPVSEVSRFLFTYERRVAESKGRLASRTGAEDSWRDR